MTHLRNQSCTRLYALRWRGAAATLGEFTTVAWNKARTSSQLATTESVSLLSADFSSSFLLVFTSSSSSELSLDSSSISDSMAASDLRSAIFVANILSSAASEHYLSRITVSARNSGGRTAFRDAQ